MYLKLTWTDPNVGAHTLNIYRGKAPLDRANLGTPLVTLTNGEVQYDDTTVERGKLYYYVFETVIGSDKAVSPNYPMQASVRRGPGPTDLKYGDYDYGYFGTIASANFINGVELAAKVGLTVGASTAQGPIWHKYVRNNKICFIPEGSIRSTLNWKNLYDAGLVFGVDGPGPYNAGADVNQLKTVTIGPDTFKVRLMNGYSDDYTKFCQDNVIIGEPVEAFTCEWDDFVYPIYQYVPTAQRMVNVANKALADLRLDSQYWAWCQERAGGAAGTHGVVRGSNSATRLGVSARTTQGAWNVSPSANHCWWPVLELIEQ